MNTVDFKVPSEHPCYEDHFPVQAIVPGALLIEWLGECWKNAQSAPFQLQHIPTLKFLSPVYPGELLRFEYQDKSDTVAVICYKCVGNELTAVLKGKFAK